MRKNILAIILLMAAAGSAVAQTSEKPENIPPPGVREVDVALSNDTLQLKYIANGSKVGVRNTRFSGAFFLSEDRDIVLSGGLLFPVDYDLGRFNVVIGPQLYAALLTEPTNDVMAVSIGAEVRFILEKEHDLAVMAFGYYAPDILTFGSADKVVDVGGQLELPLSKKMRGFLGYRYFQFDLTQGQGNKKLQNQIYLGLGYRF